MKPGRQSIIMEIINEKDILTSVLSSDIEKVRA